MPTQDSAAKPELPLPPPIAYLTQRCLTLQFAADNGIVIEPPQLIPHALRFMPREFERVTHALLLRCRDFDGTYHESANQAVLFGSFTNADTAEPMDRQRFSARGI